MRTKIVCSAVVALFVISNFGIVLVNEQNTYGIIAVHIETKASGTTYYVVKDGNDSNPGTLSEPWRTIGKANSELVAGDNVRIRVGTYTDQIRPVNNGTSGDARIVYEAYGDGNVILTNCGGSSEGAIWLASREYVTVSGIDRSHQYIRVEPTENISRYATLDNAHHCIIEYIRMGEGTGKANYGVTMGFAYGSYSYQTYNVLRGCFALGGTSGYFTEDLIMIAQDGFYNLIEDNVFEESGHVVLYVLGDGTLYPGSDPHHNIIRNNTVKNSYHTGMNSLVGTYRNLWENNRAIDGGHNNIDYAGASFQHASSYDLIRYNLITRGGSSGGGSTFGFYTSSAADDQYTQSEYCRIYGNTIAYNSGIGIKNMWGSSNPDLQAIGHNVLVNNILYKNENDQFEIDYYNNDEAPGGYNDYWAFNLIGIGGGIDVIRGRSLAGQYEDWNLSEVEAGALADGDLGTSIKFENNIEGDPLFVDASMEVGHDDFSVQYDSNCIDSGGALTVVATADIGSGMSLIVADALFFQDSWGMQDMGVQPDWIAVGTVNNVVQISSINYITNTVTLASSISRNDGDSIWLYKDSSGRRVLYGSAPDIGAYEYQSNTYYVDASNGNDSNPGTESEPWLTIQHATDTMVAGDTVYIKQGIYEEIVDLTGGTGVEGKSGNEVDGYITYQGYPGHNAVLDGTTFQGQGGGGIGFWSGKWVPSGGDRTVNYIKIKDLTVRNYPEAGIEFGWDSNGKGSHHIIIENLTVYNNGDVGIYIWEGRESAGTTHDIIIRNCKSYNNDNHGIKFNGDDPGVINRGHIHNSIIENCISHDNLYIGIHVSTGNYNITVRNNTCYNNGQQGITGHEIWDSEYENNIVYENGKSGEDEKEGMAIWNSKNITIRGNRIYGNPGYGLKFWEDLADTGSSHTIENNVIFNNQEGGIEISIDVNNGRIYHNTIASNQGTGLNIAASVSGHDIKNNIIYQNSDQLLPGSGNTFDYNLYYPDISFSGKGVHSISGYPLFVDPSNPTYDFHLQSTSPAIDSGTEVGINKDIEGNLRPQGLAPDIGAYEFSLTLPIEITKPKDKYLYIFDREIMPSILGNAIIIGRITIKANVYSEDELDRVEFYIDDILKSSDSEQPYEWLGNERGFGRHEIKVIAYDNKGNTAEDRINVMIFNLGGVN